MRQLSTSSFRSRTLVAAVATVMVVTISPAFGQDISDLRRQREEAREAEQEALEQIDLLRADDEVIKATLDEIQALVDAQTARVEGARQALEAAENEVRYREQLATDAAAAVVTTTDHIRVRAVDAYVGTDSTIEPWLMSGDPNRTAIRLALLDFAAGNERDLLDELRTVQANLEENVRLGEDARLEADRLRGAFESALGELEERRAVQLEVQAELQSRIDAWQDEVAARAASSDEISRLIDETVANATGLSPGSPSAQGFIMPTAGRIGSGFGPRVHPIFGTVRQHTGVDIGASTGNPIWSSKAGEVIFAGWKGGYGNTVLVAHEGGVVTLYAHMSVIHAGVGDPVDQGDTIGEIGSTGFSTGPHLHFEVRVGGEPNDPVLFLS
ncbi:MAG: peptidoglycan DD-metalloendopeptidase family protein [Actinomycetota bacterium]